MRHAWPGVGSNRDRRFYARKTPLRASLGDCVGVVADGETNKSNVFFLDSCNMRGFLTLISGKAGSLYCLLNDSQAEIGRTEVFMSEFSVNQKCGKREKRETNVPKR